VSKLPKVEKPKENHENTKKIDEPFSVHKSKIINQKSKIASRACSYTDY